MQAVVLLAAGPHAVRGPVREIRAGPGSPQGCAAGLLHGAEGDPPPRIPGPQCRGAARGFIRLRRARPGRTRRACSQPLLGVGVYPASGGAGPPRAPTPPHGEGSAVTHVPQCITLHLQCARLIASRFRGERHVGRLPGPEEAGRGAGGVGAPRLAAWRRWARRQWPDSARERSARGEPGTKTQTSRGAPAGGADPGSGSRAAGGAAPREARG